MAEMKTSIIMQLVDRVTRPVRRVTQSLSRVSRRAGLNRLTAQARRVKSAIGGMISNLGNLTRNLAMMGGAAAGAVWGLHRLVSGFTEPADAAIKLSRRVSLTHEEVQKLMGAAERMTTGGGQMIASNLARFSRRMAEAAAGTGEAADAYEWAGIQLRDSSGQMRSGMEVIKDLMDTMENMESKDMQQRFAQAVFGRSGEEMVNLLNQGRGAFEAALQEWTDTGELQTKEQAEAAERYNDNMENLMATIRGVRNTVIGSLLPALNQWLQRITRLTQANRGVITEEVLSGIRKFWTFLRRVGSVVSRVADRVGGFTNLLIGLAGLLAGKLVLSLAAAVIEFGRLGWMLTRNIISGIAMLSSGLAGLAARAIPAAIAGVRALSVALVTTPVGWILTAIAAIAGAAYLIYRNWETISRWWGDMWSGIKGVVSDGVKWVAEHLSPSALLEMGKNWIGGLWDGIKAKWSQFTGWLAEKVRALTGWMPDWVKGKLGLSEIRAPAPADGNLQSRMGPPARGNATAAGRTEVGGELRITIDSEGRPRVNKARQRGPMSMSVDSGILGMVP